MRIWATLWRKQKIWKDAVYEAGAGTLSDEGFLDEACRALDIPRPLVLGKHENEWEAFGRTTFRAGEFLEEIPFEKFEIELLKERGRSRDPRNDFGNA